MRIFTAIALSFLLLSCGPKPTPVPPPNPPPNSALLIAAAAAEATCEISATLVSPAAAAWLTGPCPTAISGIINTIDAAGTVAAMQAAITAMQASYASIPPGTLTPQDRTYIVAAIQAAQLVLTIYEQETGQVPASDKAKLKPLKARADNWKKTHGK